MTPVAAIPNDVAEQLSDAMAHVITQVLHRYGSEA